MDFPTDTHTNQVLDLVCKLVVHSSKEGGWGGREGGRGGREGREGEEGGRGGREGWREG